MKRKEKNNVIKILKITIGSIILGLGIVFANMTIGADPLSYFWEGVSVQLNISLGFANLIVSFVLLLIPLIYDRKQINIGTILSPVIIGLTIDSLLPRMPLITSLAATALVFIFAVFCYTLGVAIYVKEDLGRSTYDGSIDILKDRAHISIKTAKTIADTVLFTLAILLGVPFAWGPFVFVLVSGTLIELFLNMLNKYDKIGA